ncbi:MAG: aminotransferase class III-fold pyridoxal phosphate-dependent enzyme [Candidatus Latescibacteria bacterium]|nr:aminotransferase class III-fold pyridoxal phosphate-dependent enzyme [Candidatus Latescibacterota bacterium]
MDENARLLDRLSRQYFEEYPSAQAEFDRAEESLIDGGSHTLRLFGPAPFRIVGASGSRLTDSDGHEILDFWQGHYANVLGHNPPLITQVLAQRLGGGYGLHTGITESLQTDFAALLLKLIGAEKIRFTSSGALADMYSIMLARAFTGRPLIVKVGGGWQGAHPLALKGVSFRDGYDHSESAGLSPNEVESVLLTRYNDPEDLTGLFQTHGDRIACFIVEPWMGMGGFMPATPEYLRTARELTHKYGAVLIFDEIISGFRFCAGGVFKLYGVQPDISTYAKVIGGGMPLAAVAGREEIMRLCSPGSERRVKFDGGTFSAHPAALLAGNALVEYLAEHENDIYPRLGMLGEKMRRGVEEAFAREGIYVQCTGYGNEVVTDSSLGMIHFPVEEGIRLTCPDQVWNPAVCDVERREKVLKLAFLLEKVYVMHGLGVLSTEHTEDDLEWLFAACEGAARRIKT